jgi:hypothetical protein
MTARDLSRYGQKWLARLTPFFTEKERKQAGCQHRLFFSQIEFCDNLIFHRRAALDKLGERLLDANRTIGEPNRVTVIFSRKQYRGTLQTEIEDMDPPNPVIRSRYHDGFIKQYARPPDPPHRGGQQQCDRLRSEQCHRTPSHIAGTNIAVRAPAR